jgi:hypothetical protein
MRIEVDVIVITSGPSLYVFHLVRPAARRWVRKHVKEHGEHTGKTLAVERRFARDIVYGMSCDGLRVTSDAKAVLP